METVRETMLPNLPPPRRGKVRDIYDLGTELLIVATDRLSAYDFVLEPGIPGKGKILTQLSNFWFDKLAAITRHHLIATDPDDFPASLKPHRELLEGRAVLVRKAEVIPFECVARGYLAGSGFREYRAGGTLCGIPLPPGLRRADRLPEPIFTPATKAEEGHDENVSFEYMASHIGRELSEELRERTLRLYTLGAEHAAAQGLILADTKFEFGMLDDGVILIDEVLTPDSSRYWDRAQWNPGEEPVSFDKQYVRNYLDTTDWDKASPPPRLPPEVVIGTHERYKAAFEKITGREPVL